MRTKQVAKETGVNKRKKKLKSTANSLVIASHGITKEKTKGKTRGKTKLNFGKLIKDKEVGEHISGINIRERQVAYKVHKNSAFRP